MIKTDDRIVGLLWWQWGKVLGLIGLAFALSGQIDNRIVLAIIAHIFVDFTAQSGETAAGKANKNFYTLLYHSFISGGWPIVILNGNPAAILISFLVHLLVDSTNKFSLAGWLGIVLDQTSHLLTIVVLAIIF